MKKYFSRTRARRSGTLLQKYVHQNPSENWQHIVKDVYQLEEKLSWLGRKKIDILDFSFITRAT